MKRLHLMIAVAAVAQACSGESSPADGGPLASACGLASVSPATECTGLPECGAGAQNFTVDPTCDNCPHRADSHVCEAGACRAMDPLELVSVLISVGPEGVGAQGFTIATINPISADGSKVTCAQLMSSGCERLGNATLNVTNSTHKRFSSGAASSDMVYQTGISGEPGADRIIFVQATEEQSGDGRIMAWGCVDGLTVPLPADQSPLGITLVGK